MDPSYEDVNNAFERSLVFMHKVSFCLNTQLEAETVYEVAIQLRFEV
jgi:hypothetical protein